MELETNNHATEFLYHVQIQRGDRGPDRSGKSQILLVSIQISI